MANTRDVSVKKKEVTVSSEISSCKKNITSSGKTSAYSELCCNYICKVVYLALKEQRDSYVCDRRPKVD